MPLSSSIVPALPAIQGCPPAWTPQAFGINPPLPELGECHVTCEALSWKREIPIRLQRTVTKENRTLLLNSFLRIEQFRPEIANYINFVLTYLENFKIHVDTKSELTKLGLKPQVIGLYLPFHRAIVLATESLDDPSLVNALAHEFTHAFWHTMQLYSFSHKTYLPHCFYPITRDIEAHLAALIQKGDDRMSQLSKDLQSEKAGTLDRKTKQKFTRLREQCQDLVASNLFPMEIPMMPQINLAELPLDREYEFPQAPYNTYGKVKILSKKKALPMSAVVLCFQDPLIHVASSISRVKQAMKERYSKDVQVFERQAFLMAEIPSPLLQEYWPELVAYLDNLVRQKMQHPSPLAGGPTAKFTTHQIYEAGLRTQLLDRDAMSLQLALGIAPEKLIDDIKAVMRRPEHYDMQPDQIKFYLTTLIQKGIKVKEANLLMAKLESQQSDGLNACRYFMRAYKQGEAFTFEDYISCLNTLMTNNQWGDAKIICQKALAKYRAEYDGIFLPTYQQVFQRDYLAPLQVISDKIKARRPR